MEQVVEPAAASPDAVRAGDASARVPPAPQVLRRWPGRLALASGALTAVAVAVGIALAEAELFREAWTAALFASVASAVAVHAGLVAAIGGWARGAGIAGVVLGVVANPYLLTRGLDLVAAL